jgi:hypothetical protein
LKTIVAPITLYIVYFHKLELFRSDIDIQTVFKLIKINVLPLISTFLQFNLSFHSSELAIWPNDIDPFPTCKSAL